MEPENSDSNEESLESKLINKVKDFSIKDYLLAISVMINIGVIGILSFKTIPDQTSHKKYFEKTEQNYSIKTKVETQLDDSYLAKKEGFLYVLDDRKKVDSSLFEIGIEKTLEIDCDYNHYKKKTKCEYHYMISNFNGKRVLAETRIQITANSKKEVNYVWISDQVNNLKVKLKYKKNDDKLSVDGPLNEKNGRKLFEKYSKSFKDFFEENGIEDKIKNYSPKLEITERSIN